MRMMLPELATSASRFRTRDSNSPRSFAPAMRSATSSCRIRLSFKNRGKGLPSGSFSSTIARAKPSAMAVCNANVQVFSDSSPFVQVKHKDCQMQLCSESGCKMYRSCKMSTIMAKIENPPPPCSHQWFWKTRANVCQQSKSAF